MAAATTMKTAPKVPANGTRQARQSATVRSCRSTGTVPASSGARSRDVVSRWATTKPNTPSRKAVVIVAIIGSVPPPSCCTSCQTIVTSTTMQGARTAGAGRSAGPRRARAHGASASRRRQDAGSGHQSGTHDTASRSGSRGRVADQQQVGVLEGGSISSADGGGSPTLRYRPVPVRQESCAAGSRSVGHPDPAGGLGDQVRHRAVEADRPPSRTTTRSHSAATSSVWWVESSTVGGSPARPSTSRSRPRCSGSRPAVGSSRTSRSGRRAGPGPARPGGAGRPTGR